MCGSILLDVSVSEGWIPSKEKDLYASISEHQLYELLLDRFHVSDQHLMRTLAPHHNTLFRPSHHRLFLDNSFRRWGEGCYQIYETAYSIGYALFNPYTSLPTPLSQKERHLYWISKKSFLRLEESPISSKKPSYSWKKTFGPTITNLLVEALYKKASDIHFFTLDSGCRCDFRIHGELYTHQILSQSEWRPLLNRLKFHGNLDLSVHLKPQDGRLMEQNLSCRISTLPSLHGEDLVIRFTRSADTLTKLSKIGMSDIVLEKTRQMIKHTAGLILVTGPTGSGKTTTLYSILDTIVSTSRRVIVTLEDPIERDIPSVRQSQINRLSGYGFSEGLRAVLRQDPDIILIGEIRDKETAQTALEAAYTGHLVLSSLHTSTIRDSLLRLLSFDVDPFLIGQSLRGMITQRLDPIICHNCQGRGCSICQQAGILGRQAFHSCFQPHVFKFALDSQSIDNYLNQGFVWTFKDDENLKRSLTSNP